MEGLEKSDKSMFTGIIQNTSLPLCLDLQFKCLLDGKQKVPNFFLSTTYYKRPDIILNIVNTEVWILFWRQMAPEIGHPSRYERNPQDSSASGNWYSSPLPTEESRARPTNSPYRPNPSGAQPSVRQHKAICFQILYACRSSDQHLSLPSTRHHFSIPLMRSCCLRQGLN